MVSLTDVGRGVLRLEKVAPSGWCWNMLLISLKDGGLLVHSPTWLGDDTFERIDALGEVRVLFAPNHFHHLSLQRFRERYPRAIAVAGEGAQPRLAKKGHTGLADVGTVADLLPAGARWLPCEGTKTGETWLSLAGPAEGERTLIVCDAFFNVERPVTGMTGFALRALRVVGGLEISRTYQWLGVREPRRYREWTLATIANERPTRLAPSHGELASSPDLPERLVELVRARIG